MVVGWISHSPGTQRRAVYCVWKAASMSVVMTVVGRSVVIVFWDSCYNVLFGSL